MSSRNTPLPGNPSPARNNATPTRDSARPSSTVESPFSSSAERERARRSEALSPESRPRRNAIVEAMHDPTTSVDRLLARIPLPASQPAPISGEELDQALAEAERAAMGHAATQPFELDRARRPNPDYRPYVAPPREFPGPFYPRGPYLGFAPHEIEWYRDPFPSDRIPGHHIAGHLPRPRGQIQTWERASSDRGRLARRFERVRRGERADGEREFEQGGSDEEDESEVVVGEPVTVEGEVVLGRAGWRVVCEDQDVGRADVVVGRVARVLREEMARYYGRL